MDREWADSQPIYRQLRDRGIAMILEGVLKEGDPLPSVRTVAADYRLNPLTVLKAYQELVDEGLVETRRGAGGFVLTEDWPRIRETMLRLGLKPEDLLSGNASRRQKSKMKKEER